VAGSVLQLSFENPRDGDRAPHEQRDDGLPGAGCPSSKVQAQNMAHRDPGAVRYRMVLLPIVGILGFVTLAWCVAAEAGIVPSVFPRSPLGRGDDVVFLVFTVVACSFLVALRMWCVLLDSNGIHVKGYRRWRPIIRWGEVASVKLRGFALVVETHDGRRVQVPAMVSHALRPIKDDLPQYLARFRSGASLQGPVRASGGLPWDPVRLLGNQLATSIPAFVYRRIAAGIAIAKWIVLLALVPFVLCLAVAAFASVSLRVRSYFIVVLAIGETIAILLVLTIRNYLKTVLRSLHSDQCWTCGYDLRGFAGGMARCPECGTDVDFKTLHEKWAPLKKFIRQDDEAR